ncbi:MAG: coproporphyrinogen-III oxidase family protein [Spirochaetales bacterium]|nr:coproporphyrinogen-III oxidase family protein [Spirochaetales bacterium]
MYIKERFRSHHDAEHRLGKLLGIEAHSRKSVMEWDEAAQKLKNETPKKGRCIYFHVPFCDTICSFCNLNRRKGMEDEVKNYADYLLEEIKKYASHPYVQEEEFNTVYFGGGTPTILDEGALEKVLTALFKYLPMAKECEITMESTLHNLTPSKVEFLQDLGVNRLSLGVQSFSDRGREILNRTGGRDFCIDRIGTFREIFHGTLGADIIYSYPEQTKSQVLDDASLIHDLGIDSVSFYSLMIHDKSVLGGKIDRGEIVFDRSLKEDRENHNSFYSYLTNRGYELLELSKLVRPGRDEYRYIKNRYANGDVLPLGQGAGGRLGLYRIYNMAPGKTMVSPLDKDYDRLHHILGFLQYGLYDPNHILPYLGRDLEEEYGSDLKRYVSQGFLELKQGEYKLTPDGIFWGNNLAVDLLEKYGKRILKGEVCYA